MIIKNNFENKFDFTKKEEYKPIGKNNDNYENKINHNNDMNINDENDINNEFDNINDNDEGNKWDFFK